MEGEENSSAGISISVIDTQLSSDKIGKHVRYSISGKDETGPFACLRRYKEFSTLRQVLVIIWPGCYVPQIPQKQALGNLETDFVQVRRKLLDYFLKQISQLDYLFKSEAFQLFIRGPPDYIKASQDMKYTGYSQIGQNMRERYSEFYEFKMAPEHESQLEDACQYFKTGLEALEKFEKVCKENVVNFNELKGDVKNLMVGIKEISSFYAEKYGGTAVGVLEREEKENPYEDLLYWTLRDVLDLRAIIDCLVSRTNLINVRGKIQEKLDVERGKLVKLQSGKKSLGQLFSKKTKEDHIQGVEVDIKKCEEDIESCNVILTIVTGRLIEIVISEFKEIKTKNFEMIMQRFIDISVRNYSHFVEEAKCLESSLS